jgi:hypothetical protein
MATNTEGMLEMEGMFIVIAKLDPGSTIMETPGPGAYCEKLNQRNPTNFCWFT